MWFIIEILALSRVSFLGTDRLSLGEVSYPVVLQLICERARVHLLSFFSLVAQTVQCLPTVWETWVQSLGWEDLLEKEMTTHSSILA